MTGVLPCYHIYGLYVINLLSMYQAAKVVSFPAFDPGLFVKVIREHKVRKGKDRERAKGVRKV